MARKEPKVAQTRLLDDNATLGPMINAALRKIDALESEVRLFLVRIRLRDKSQRKMGLETTQPTVVTR